MPRKLLVIDTSYAYEAIIGRKLEASVTCRDLDGFFEHVWTVHPFASLVTEGLTARFGGPEFHSLGAAHTFIDGKLGRFPMLGPVPLLNFVASQAETVGRLVALIRREKITAIRAGDPLYCGLLGLALARASGIPLVVRVNANFDASYASTGRVAMPRLIPSRRLEKQVLRFVLSRADLVAAVNQDNLDFAIANGARRERGTIFRYGNLLDKRHIAPPGERDRSWSNLASIWSERCRFIMHVGRLESIKCPEDVIKAFERVRSCGYDVKLLMVGDGSERGALVELSRALGVSEHVAFCGNRDQAWLAQVIPLASVVVSPITGRALSEVAFGAAPIAAYDLDWQGELIRTGETGELVPARDWEKLALAAQKFLDDPSYARAMGEAVRKRAFEMLDPATLDEHERQQYRKVFQRFDQGG